MTRFFKISIIISSYYAFGYFPTISIKSILGIRTEDNC